MTQPRPVALTMGDPAGIGGELTLKAWLARSSAQPFVALDDPARLAALAAFLDLPVPVQPVESADEAAAIFDRALPVLPCPLPVPAHPGSPDPANAPAVIASIERAVALTRSGETAALVTNPIAKSVLQAAGFAHPGHTEFLAALAGGQQRAVMMLACPELRVVPITIHIPLSAVPGHLTRELILETARITARDLNRHFGLTRPRLAVAGLNPHAGEDGRMGDEEIRVITPALDILRAEGLTVIGPLSADTLFHAAARKTYDVALCMYHDQALIPLKTLDFNGGVNITLGLPFIRTSPDHGTAFDIAGRGIADPGSLLAALRQAHEMAAHVRPS